MSKIFNPDEAVIKLMADKRKDSTYLAQGLKNFQDLEEDRVDIVKAQQRLLMDLTNYTTQMDAATKALEEAKIGILQMYKKRVLGGNQ